MLFVSRFSYILLLYYAYCLVEIVCWLWKDPEDEKQISETTEDGQVKLCPYQEGSLAVKELGDNYPLPFYLGISFNIAIQFPCFWLITLQALTPPPTTSIIDYC